MLLKPQAAKDNVVIAINVARASRYPALEELYYNGPHPGNLAFEVGNADLNAEHALGFDVSLRGQGRRFEGELTYFRNDISDYIFRIRPTGEVEDEFPVVENIAADSVLSGIEAHADVRITNELSAEATYDWVEGELDSGDPLPRIPPFRVIVGLTYQKNAFQVGGSAQIVSGQNRVYGEETPTAGYTTAKFFAAYSFTRGGVLNTITARLDNATDALYRNHLNYLKDVLAEVGRSFKLVYTVGF